MLERHVASYYLTVGDKRVAFHFGQGVRYASPRSMSILTVRHSFNGATASSLSDKPCSVPTNREIR